MRRNPRRNRDAGARLHHRVLLQTEDPAQLEEYRPERIHVHLARRIRGGSDAISVRIRRRKIEGGSEGFPEPRACRTSEKSMSMYGRESCLQTT